MDEGRERANSGTEKKKPTEKTNKRRNKEGRQKGRDKLLPRRAGEGILFTNYFICPGVF